MAKIICEICGTAYPDSADCCPICGYSPKNGAFTPEQAAPEDADLYLKEEAPREFDDMDLDNLDLSEFDDIPVYEEPQYQEPQYQASRYEYSASGPAVPPVPPQPQEPYASQPTKRIFDYDAVNPPKASKKQYEDYEDVGSEVTLNDYPEDSYDNYDQESGKSPRSHTGLVVFLVVMIVALIAASAFLVTRFILPNLGDGEPAMTEPLFTETFPETPAEAPTTVPTTEPTVPCEILTLVGEEQVELSRKGQFYLIHASASPENTTDAISYDSEDETIVTVDNGGKITAVGEGQTSILVTCGIQMARLPVTVAFREEEPPRETGEMPPMATEKDPEAQEETEATEDDRDEGLKDVELKLKKTDLSSGTQGVSFQLELDCDLEPTEVEWLSTNGAVAIVKDGMVTTVGPGVCKIVATYGSQQVSCVVRCTF